MPWRECYKMDERLRFVADSATSFSLFPVAVARSGRQAATSSRIGFSKLSIAM